MELKKMNLEIRKYTEKDLTEIIRIWNEVVDEGIALATCMAKPMEGSTWELCKLGSNKNRKHSGSGSLLYKPAVEG